MASEVSTANRAPMKKSVRMAYWTFGIAMVLMFIAGLLHTPAGRPLLAKLGFGCPVRAGTPEEVDRARAFGAQRFQGQSTALARPALGFVFEKTTLAEVEAWAAQHHVTCEKISGTETLRACSDVPPAAIGQPDWFGPAEEVSFGFHSARTLASVSTMRRRLGITHANAIAKELSDRLHRSLGAAHITGGENEPGHFAKGPLQTYMNEWTFSDYGVTLSEVRLADTGIMVREQYLSAVP